MIELRDYQQDILGRVRQAMQDGYKRILVCLPCRSGKSYIFAKISQLASDKGNQVLIIAHRKELIRQHKELYEQFGLLGLNIRIESVFTEARHVGEHGIPSVIIIDEAHLAGADSYHKVCQAYPDAYVIGFSATPQRMDGKGLDDLFDILIVGISVRELQSMGAIAEFDYFAPYIPELKGIHTKLGDYDKEELANRMIEQVHATVESAINAYRQYADSKQGLVYCVDIAHSDLVAEEFNKAGIPAISVSSKTPKPVRDNAIADFKKGKYRMLVNCNLFSEGITLPEADFVIMLRPTKSYALFIQQSMRCLTPQEGKKAVIFDLANNYAIHGLPNDPHVWRLEGKAKSERNGSKSVLIRRCPNCLAVVSANTSKCPICGFEFQVKEKELKEETVKVRKIEQLNRKNPIFDEYERLEKIQQERGYKKMWIVRTMENGGYIKTYGDLYYLSIMLGYKPGWAWREAKQRGIR